MAYNNTILLTGNLGSEASVHEADTPFATVSLATTDSYKNESGEWINKKTQWHNLIIFSPAIISAIKALKAGTRIKITGTISYRPLTAKLDDGQEVPKQEASIVVHKLELAPLVKRS